MGRAADVAGRGFDAVDSTPKAVAIWGRRLASLRTAVNSASSGSAGTPWGTTTVRTGE